VAADVLLDASNWRNNRPITLPKFLFAGRCPGAPCANPLPAEHVLLDATDWRNDLAP
jgi:hypothetical protein